VAQLPQELRELIDREAEAAGPRQLKEAAAALSAAFRAGNPFVFKTEADCAAYAVTRLPAVYAALTRVLATLPLKPASLLDLGAGPGAGALAAVQRFGPLEPVTLVEPDSALAALGRRLGARATRWMVDDLDRPPAYPPHDLVVLSYSSAAGRVLDLAWDAARHALAIVEPGTPAGFRRILEARGRLLARGAFLAAPCPHHRDCPLDAPDWCHFAARVERTRHHRLAREAGLGWEDEKFSYLIATREPHPAPARILRRPHIGKGFIQLRLCTPEGVAAETISRRQGARWRAARKAVWGGAWSEPALHYETDPLRAPSSSIVPPSV
jgi:ribosomal protein RSM22 (predicted rRNA methylase)